MTRRRKQTRQPRRRLGPIPDSVLADGIEWSNDPDVVSFELRWDRWNAAKKLIDEDWKRDAERQIAAVTDSVEAGLLMNRLEAERESNETADAVTTQKYFDELKALHDRVWMERAKKRLAAATRSINKDIARKERRLFHFFGR
jgi:hypothetical protein